MDLSPLKEFRFSRNVFTEQQWYRYTEGVNMDAAVSSVHRHFNADNFNTSLPANKTVEYNNWSATNRKIEGRTELDSGHDYDYQGAFMKGLGRSQAGDIGLNGKAIPQDQVGHLDDEFKKPNHVTFSTESIYAQGKYAKTYGKYAGRWIERNGQTMYQPSKAMIKAVNKQRSKLQGE